MKLQSESGHIVFIFVLFLQKHWHLELEVISRHLDIDDYFIIYVGERFGGNKFGKTDFEM